MSTYIKDRFSDYKEILTSAAIEKPKKLLQIVDNKKEEKTKFTYYNSNSSRMYFKIMYSSTNNWIDILSVQKTELARDSTNSIRIALSEALEIPLSDIRMLSQNKDNYTFECQVDYGGSPTNYVTYKVEPMDDDNYGESAEIKSADPKHKYTPYKNGQWGKNTWYCMKCGFVLDTIAENLHLWGTFAWDNMRENGTQWYLCSNKNCYHNDAPLILHSPKDWEAAATDSYSLSWIK